jgi:hypothetical protein
MWITWIVLATTGSEVVLDQAQEFENGSINLSSATLTAPQSVTAGVSGRLDHIEVFVLSPGSAELFINRGAPWQTDEDEFVTTFVAETM